MIDDSCAVVPNSWVRKSRCFWPLNDNDAYRFAEAGQEPGSDWLDYEIKKIGVFRKNFKISDLFLVISLSL